MVAEEAVRKLLRHHPLVNPSSAAGRAFESVGLGHLSFLDTEEQHPWGCFLEECVAGLQEQKQQQQHEPWSKPQFGATLELLAAAAGDEAITEAVASVQHRIKSEVLVCFLASHAYQHPEAEALAAAFSTALSAAMAGPTTAILCDGSQAAFSKNCHDPSRLWHLAFHGEVNGARHGTTLHCCKNAEEKRAITGKLCQAYVVLEGGPSVVEEVGIALENGAFVLPIPRCGGAASGQHHFPEVALGRPDWVHEEDWKLLSDCFAPLEETAAAAARIVAAYCSVLLPPAMEVAAPRVPGPAAGKGSPNQGQEENDGQPSQPRQPSVPQASATPPRNPTKNRGNGPPLPRPRGSARQAAPKASAREDPLAALEAEEAQLLEEVLSLAKREEELLHKGSADEYQQGASAPAPAPAPAPAAQAPAQAQARVPPLPLGGGAKGAGRGFGPPSLPSGQRGHGPAPPLASGSQPPPRPKGL